MRLSHAPTSRRRPTTFPPERKDARDTPDTHTHLRLRPAPSESPAAPHSLRAPRTEGLPSQSLPPAPPRPPPAPALLLLPALPPPVPGLPKAPEGVKDGEGSLLKEHTGMLARDSRLRFFSRLMAAADAVGAADADGGDEEDGVRWSQVVRSSPAAVVTVDVDALLPTPDPVPRMLVAGGVEDGVDGRPLPFPSFPLREMGRLLRLE